MATQFQPSDLLVALRHRLNALFEAYPGVKCLYIQQPILQLLNFVLDLKFEQFKTKHQINQIFSFKFENEKEEIMDQSESKVIIFFLSPQIKWMRKIAEMVINNNTRNINKKYLLLLTPRKSFLCINELEQMEVKNSIKVQNFNFGLFPMGTDTLSMQIPRSYFNLFGKSDQTILQVVAEALLKIQYALGDFNHIYGKGDLSSSIIDLIRAKDNDESYEHRESMYNISLILVDRSTDLVTPMLTPFTYEGMLDNFYNIHLNQILIPGNTVDPNASKLVTRYLLYNPLDEIYPDLTSMSIYSTEQPLKNKASSYRTVLESAKQNKNLSFQELNSLVQNQGRQYLFIQHHTLLTHSIFKKTKSLIFQKRVTMENQMLQTGSVLLENIEELAAFLTPDDWFRLICLASSVHGGLKEKLIKNIEQIACRMYGIQHSFSVSNMQKSGLLSVFSKLNWNDIKQRFNLINQDESETDKTKDYSYIYILYSSLITKMVEEVMTINDAWENPKYELLKGKTTIVNNTQSNYAKSSKQKLYFVFVVGGITYGEIHSLRQLSRKLGQRIIICSTRVTGGKGIVSECFEA